MANTEGDLVSQVNNQFIVSLGFTISMDRLIDKYRNIELYIVCVCIHMYI